MIKRLLVFFLVLCTCFSFAACNNAAAEETTTATSSAYFQENPADDSILSLLMIGNSGSYYYTDELYKLLTISGVNAVVANLYYSGCTITRHWEWKQSGEAKYELHIIDADGKRVFENYTMEAALQHFNWDAISLQEAFFPKDTVVWDEAANRSLEPAKNLYAYLGEKFPNASFFWHQTPAFQVGFLGSSNKDPETVPVENRILTVEKQTEMYNLVRESALNVCEAYQVGRVPSGDAWQIARANPAVGDILCNKKTTDFYHDGDIGGGQYLNACVWYETLTGMDCRGHKYRPSYGLSEELVAALQEAAHQAVAAMTE